VKQVGSSSARRLLLAWTALLGCGSDGGGARISTVDALVDGMAAATCAWQFRCCSVPELVAVTSGLYTTEQDCRQRLALQIGEQLATARVAVTEGREAVDPAAAAACVAEVRDASCNLVTALGVLANGGVSTPDACGRILTGKVRAGHTCLAAADCTAGSRCIFPGGATGAGGVQGNGLPTTSSPGACVPYQAAGDICNANTDCDATQGLYCRGTDYRCAPYAQEGDTCSISTIDPLTGAPTGGGVITCDPLKNLWCDGASGSCRHLPRAGEACLGFTPGSPSGNQCDPDPALALFCVGAGFNGSGVCEAAAREGDACGASGLPPCGTGLVCTTQTQTVTPPGGGPPTIGVCAAAATEGQSCAALGACLTPAVCNPATKICDLPGPSRPGEACSANTQCATMLCGPSVDGSGAFVCLPGQPQIACAGVNFGPGTFVPGPTTGTGGIGGIGGTSGIGGASGIGGMGPPVGGMGPPVGGTGEGGVAGSAPTGGTSGA